MAPARSTAPCCQPRPRPQARATRHWGRLPRRPILSRSRCRPRRGGSRRSGTGGKCAKGQAGNGGSGDSAHVHGRSLSSPGNWAAPMVGRAGAAPPPAFGRGATARGRCPGHRRPEGWRRRESFMAGRNPAGGVPGRGYPKAAGWPVASSTESHRSPRGLTWDRLLIARAIGMCTNRPCQRPTTISVRPAIAACTAVWASRMQ